MQLLMQLNTSVRQNYKRKVDNQQTVGGEEEEGGTFPRGTR